MKTKAWIVGAVSLLLVLAGVYLWGPSVAPPAQKPLTALSSANFGEFESAFDAASAGPRLLLLVSPT